MSHRAARLGANLCRFATPASALVAYSTLAVPSYRSEAAKLPPNADPRTNEYWAERWAKGLTGWRTTEPNPYLKRWRNVFLLSGKQRVLGAWGSPFVRTWRVSLFAHSTFDFLNIHLMYVRTFARDGGFAVPLCGDTVDIAHLAAHPCVVYGVEFVEEAARQVPTLDGAPLKEGGVVGE